MKYLCGLILMLLCCGGCAQPPQAELASARAAFAQAEATGAERLAATDYRIAARALKDSETLIDQGDYEAARRLLPFATLRAHRALVLARSAKEQARQQALSRRRQRLAAAHRQAASTPKPPTPPPPPAASPPLLPLASYTVAAGETLWTIAAQPRVYADPLLWPLLYKANRDQIRDPRQIYTGQILNIPRDLPPGELEEARQTARESAVFPLSQLLPQQP